MMLVSKIWKLMFLVIPVIFYLLPSVVYSISIETNAYKGISISFSPGLQEQDIDFQKLRAVLEKSSELLYHATRKRSYFREFIISPPLSWTEDMCKSSFTTNVPHQVDIYVTESEVESNLRTQHSGGCEKEGDIIYMPASWLRGDTSDLARQFVQQWSIYRYGVFEEDSMIDGSCYLSKSSWNPVGCYNAKIKAEPTFKNGLPECYLDSSNTELQSSLMFTNNISKAMDFCDGSASFPHNPAMPTLHNNLCEGQTVWSVIENSQDFKYGRNLPMKGSKPLSVPTLTCFRGDPIQLTFAIQNSTKGKDLTYAVAELGSSLYHFLSSIQPSKVDVNVVMFSDNADDSNAVKLDTADENKLKEQIVDNVKTRRLVSSNCVSCGFLKALSASKGKSYPYTTIILIAWESAIADEKPSEIMKVIQDLSNIQLHLVLVEDTDADVLSTELIDAIRSTGGSIFFLPKMHVFMANRLNSILSGAVKNSLQVEDNIVVVHEATYENITDNFVDSFTTLNGEVGKLVYLIHCDPINTVQTKNQNCILSTTRLDAFRCTEDLKSLARLSIKTWEFSHTYKGGTVPPTCSSVAMLHRSSVSKNGFTLRGWLNKYAIKAGYDPLIIYAETISYSSQKYRVEAQISGPDDFSATVELRDNGNGDPDVKREDGIFCRYFTPPFLKKGSYMVTISAETTSGGGKNTFFAEAEVSVQQQTKNIGFFSVIESGPDIDILPPNRVADLRVVSIDGDNGTVTLQWTAPGNDFDNGTATSYEIKHSTHSASLWDKYFNSEENMILKSKSELIPRISGSIETVQFLTPNSYDTTYYIALRANDANKNQGKISNIIQVYIKDSHITVTEEDKRTSQVTRFSSTVSTSPETENNTTDTTNTTSEMSTENPVKPETTPSPSEGNEFIFDKKYIIYISTTGGILLLIIIINIIVCCWCVKKRKKSPKPKISREASLRPPYNINIAYQEDSPGDNDADRHDIGTPLSSLANRSIYTEPNSRNSPKQQRYSYHTSKSLSSKENSNNDSELGFKLVPALPAYATSSLSRYARRLNDANSESDSEPKRIVAQPQEPSNGTHVYPLGMV